MAKLEIKLRSLCKRCQRVFRPKRDNQLYCSLRCKNREAQRRLRERARAHSEAAR